MVMLMKLRLLGAWIDPVPNHSAFPFEEKFTTETSEWMLCLTPTNCAAHSERTVSQAPSCIRSHDVLPNSGNWNLF